MITNNLSVTLKQFAKNTGNAKCIWTLNEMFSKIISFRIPQRLNDDGAACSSLYKMQRIIRNYIALLLRQRLVSHYWPISNHWVKHKKYLPYRVKCILCLFTNNTEKIFTLINVLDSETSRGCDDIALHALKLSKSLLTAFLSDVTKECTCVGVFPKTFCWCSAKF